MNLVIHTTRQLEPQSIQRGDIEPGDPLLLLVRPNNSINSNLKNLLVSRTGRIPHRNRAVNTHRNETTTHAVKNGRENT
jgi:hypothetical protein